jgi:hypothetical protein
LLPARGHEKGFDLEDQSLVEEEEGEDGLGNEEKKELKDLARARAG